MSLRSSLVAAGLLYGGVIGSPLALQHVLQQSTAAAASHTSQPDAAAAAAATAADAAPRRLHGRFLHITDLHPDGFYKLHSSTEEEDACHRGKGPAGTYGAETSDCDSPHSLIDATFEWIEKNLKDEIDFVVWTGDSARHDSDEKVPRTQDEVLGSNRMIADKFLNAFAGPGGRGLSVPVVPSLGNNDILPHNILLPGPNKWLQRYTDVWRPFIPEEQRHSFEFGGWFSVEVIPNKLAVFSLNTLYFFDRNAGVYDCMRPSEPGFKQMEWLRVQLQFVRERGMKAILVGHIPPARTESKQLWEDTCWQKYTLWLRQYRDVVVGSLYGHMNIDHFLVQDTREINYFLFGADCHDLVDAEDLVERESMEDELTAASTADYLQELRAGWSKLPNLRAFDGSEADVDPSVDAIVEDDGDGVDAGKKKKKKTKLPKLNKKLAERYQVSLVSPSIVPNYFPTLRVVEYNISGLENHPVWVDEHGKGAAATPAAAVPLYDPEEQEEQEEELYEPLRYANCWVDVEEERQGENEPEDSNKKKKKQKPKDPNLIVPHPPPKKSPPGPAYLPQTLSLTGYTQYFANLTYINNDMTHGEEDDGEEEPRGTPGTAKWREGKHHNKKPKSKPAEPRKFEFEVEYSTFSDELYGLRDLTVRSFVDLAYRMGQKTAKGREDGEVGALVEEAAEEAPEDDGEVDLSGKKKKKGKKDKKKKKKGGKDKDGEKNRIWLHFLRHAFVSTVDSDELERYD